MSELSPKELELLETIRSEWGPSGPPAPPSPAAIQERLAERPWLGRSAPPPAATRFGRLIGMTLATIGVCSVAFVALREGAPPPREAEHAAPPAVMIAASPEPEPEPEPVPALALGALPDAPPLAPAATAVREPRTGRKARDRVPAAEPGLPTSTPVDTLAEEIELIRAAQSDLRAGAPGRALTVLASHASRFPHGVLRDERMTLEALALCARGDIDAARSVKIELERSSPGSSHLQRLSSSCAR